MVKLKNYRHGDVIILGRKAQGKAIDYGYQLKADNIIIEGEITGHIHRAENGKIYTSKTDKDKIVLEADEGCVITHPEHKAIHVPKGIYEIKIQREYKNNQAQKVKD